MRSSLFSDVTWHIFVDGTYKLYRNVVKYQSTPLNISEERISYFEPWIRILPFKVAITWLTILWWLKLPWLYNDSLSAVSYLSSNFNKTIAFGEADGRGRGRRCNSPSLFDNTFNAFTWNRWGKPVKEIDVPAEIRARHLPKCYRLSRLARVLIRSVWGSKFGGVISYPHAVSWFSSFLST